MTIWLTQGSRGSGSSSSDNNFSILTTGFYQTNLVTVDHGLGYKPLVDVIDQDGNKIQVDVQHMSNNHFVVRLNQAISGTILYR